jgi:hypothetical protein
MDSLPPRYQRFTYDAPALVLMQSKITAIRARGRREQHELPSTPRGRATRIIGITKTDAPKFGSSQCTPLTRHLRLASRNITFQPDSALVMWPSIAPQPGFDTADTDKADALVHVLRVLQGFGPVNAQRHARRKHAVSCGFIQLFQTPESLELTRNCNEGIGPSCLGPESCICTRSWSERYPLKARWGLNHLH